MSIDEQFMYRCVELARKGSGFVAPNPMVGAILVHEGKIIGEGWHQRYGEAHAEVNCISDAHARGNQTFITNATLYVSLEPCAHQGKTPPCDQLIIRHKIPRVVVGCRDPFTKVNGKGIEHLTQAGIEVSSGILEGECKKINQRFFCFHQQHRPYIILKWAQTADGYIGSGTAERWIISNEITNRLVHRWRAEESAIMVGANTVRLDDPRLTNRSGFGLQPLRIIVDRQLSLTAQYKIFDQQTPTMILNEKRQGDEGMISYVQLNPHLPFTMAVCEALYIQNVQSVFIEGGAQLLSLFINSGCWDEARVIVNRSMKAATGVKAPLLKNAMLNHAEKISNDTISYYTHHQNKSV